MTTPIWICGRHAVVEALRAGIASSVAIAEQREPAHILDDIRRLAYEQNLRVQSLSLTDLERLTPGQVTQGVSAQVSYPSVSSVKELLARAHATDSAPFILVLDQIQDPHNVGALIRTADAAGAHGIIVPGRRSASVTATVAKVSAGAVSHVPTLEVTNLARAMQEMQKADIWIVGLDESTENPIYGTDLRVPLALVVGNEQSGLRRLTRENCDFIVRLPMAGVLNSLNASVAGSVAMYEVVRQRQSGAGPVRASTDRLRKD